jgi:hypothetical protein
MPYPLLMWWGVAESLKKGLIESLLKALYYALLKPLIESLLKALYYALLKPFLRLCAS